MCCTANSHFPLGMMKHLESVALKVAAVNMILKKENKCLETSCYIHTTLQVSLQLLQILFDGTNMHCFKALVFGSDKCFASFPRFNFKIHFPLYLWNIIFYYNNIVPVTMDGFTGTEFL